jgi:fatty acyl-CoA reductase
LSTYIFSPPGITFHNHWINDRIYRLFVHWLPAYIFDGLSLISGKKPRVSKLISKMHKGLDALEYFVNREWTWCNVNVHALDAEMNSTDRMLFNFRLDDMVWEDFLEHYIVGLRHNVLKYKPDTLDSCRKKFRTIYIIYHLARGVIITSVLYYIIAKFAVILEIL